jgi:hypothetical protein
LLNGSGDRNLWASTEEAKLFDESEHGTWNVDTCVEPPV